MNSNSNDELCKIIVFLLAQVEEDDTTTTQKYRLNKMFNEIKQVLLLVKIVKI